MKNERGNGDRLGRSSGRSERASPGVVADQHRQPAGERNGSGGISGRVTPAVYVPFDNMGRDATPAVRGVLIWFIGRPDAHSHAGEFLRVCVGIERRQVDWRVNSAECPGDFLDLVRMNRRAVFRVEYVARFNIPGFQRP